MIGSNKTRERMHIVFRGCEQSLAALPLLLMLCTAEARAGPKSVYDCQVFAHLSLDQNFQNIAWGCGIPTTAAGNWTGTWQENFDLCRRTDADDIDKVFNRRSHRMNMCHNLCPQYAAAAAGDVKAAKEAGCQLPSEPPGRFWPDRKAHFDWCVSGVSEELIKKEWSGRYDFTSKCTVCGNYAKEAAFQGVRNSDTSCGGSGPGWSIHPIDHYNQCMAQQNVKAWSDHWRQYRDNWLRQCPSLTDQAYCNRYADRAMSQRAVLAAKKEVGRCNPKSLDSAPDRIANYSNCLWTNRAQLAAAEAKRDALVQECVSSWRPLPPMESLADNKECKASLELHTTECKDGDGVTMQYGTVSSSGCQLGESEDDAEDRAKRIMLATFGHVLAEDPGPNQCGYEKEVFAGCTCSSGLGLRSYPGKNEPFGDAREQPSAEELGRMKAPPVVRTLPSSSEDLVAPSEPIARCASGMTLDVTGRCVCPVATVWRGKSCIDLAVSGSCPPGTYGLYPDCRHLAVPAATGPAGQCPDGFHGTPPNCCPRGTEFRNGACRPNAGSSPPPTRTDLGRCPDGFHGTPPNCCPRGTEFRDGACRSPKTSTPICPPERPIGEPPNCCPSGTSFSNGACVRASQRPREDRRRCPPGTVGTYPACCPPGTIYTGAVCLRKAKPSPRPSSPVPPPVQQAPSQTNPATQQPDPGSGLPPARKAPKDGDIFRNDGPIVN